MTGPETEAPRRARVRRLLTVAAVATLVAAGLLVALTVVGARQRAASPPSPLPDVERYLDAVAAGRAEEAYRLGDATAPSATFRSAALLTDEVLGAARRPADLRVLEVQAGPESAWADVELDLAGAAVETRLTYRWDPDAERWVMTGGLLGHLQLEPERSAGWPPPLTVAGVRAERCAPGSEDVVLGYLLYPGVYDVVLDPDGAATAREVTVVPQEDVVLPYATGAGADRGCAG